ncbi:MarR family transcriptional regulator [Apilactobacillus kunkeei]|uniref:MarR family winged helix-turn-helix transcriptional regulator n=1 Tax=Apilactobacillus TaxID=2767877 RepID=UPI00059B3202|nr:MarR family winged helix-turn-helix transcriptional regulator [Apilactobacillus kunkeei]KIM18709.1 MarR family transcriptional regulator [Apilactobacillus kunkeei]KPN84062.1 Bacterial regulatory protein, MarR [Apilactobacillus kunkeei]MCK8619359.1 MarR family winged helix-turn-helix transcriptional regulator [Apilactobacillus kunkeei]MCK8620700.1 MarR family winged helix-turn-helix transcriptional regulator [Apilactobacillus kunkeei]MCK8625694.1 MarR family winged helix-turn-helix transcrip
MDSLKKIGVIARSLDSISNIEFKEYSLSKGQYLYLVRIGENPGIILQDLCELICVDKTTGSRAVNNLVKASLVVKRTEKTNKKNQLLYLTTKGEELYKVVARENEYSNNVALKGFTEEEKTIFNRLLDKAKDNIYKDWQEVKNGGKRKY